MTCIVEPETEPIISFRTFAGADVSPAFFSLQIIDVFPYIVLFPYFDYRPIAAVALQMLHS